ncbi:hypothetical protein FACS1894130_00810 [Spirochaetia bacterium]|nr:hypothetical protein FACS1894130_00810 [Spirochaetia bacterium]
MIVPGLPLSLAAQSNSNSIQVWVAPVKGGTAADQEYFNFNLQEEVKGGGYILTNGIYFDVANDAEHSDFYITTELYYDEEYDENVITMELYNTITDALIVTNGMSYDTTDMMNDWNLTLIYRLMANAPIEKFTAEGLEGYLGEHIPSEIPDDYYLWVGIRGGYSMRFYNFEGLALMGHTFEAGGQISYKFQPFLGLQAEFLLTMDNAYYLIDNDSRLATPSDMSLMIPLMVKGIFRPGPSKQFSINPLVGAFIALPLNKNNNFNGGLSAGMNLGFRLGKTANLFFDIRYSFDFSNTIHATYDKAIHKRSMITLTMGYELGFIKRKAAKKKQTAAPVSRAPSPLR